MKYWTGVGSRDIPQETYDLLVRIAQHMALNGYTVRSGAAEGADTAVQEGACMVNPKLTEIWIPWKSFKPKKYVPEFSECIYKVPNDTLYEAARNFYISPTDKYPQGTIAWFDKMSQGARKLHARNYYQVVGDKPTRDSFVLSEVCIYAAPEDSKGNVKGGTRSAVEVSRHYGVPTYNLMIEEQKNKLLEILKLEE